MAVVTNDSYSKLTSLLYNSLTEFKISVSLCSTTQSQKSMGLSFQIIPVNMIGILNYWFVRSRNLEVEIICSQTAQSGTWINPVVG